jgi:Tfp pilus assembly protein PilZ
MADAIKNRSVTERLLSLIGEMSDQEKEDLVKKLEARPKKKRSWYGRKTSRGKEGLGKEFETSLKKERRLHSRKTAFAFVEIAYENRILREVVKDISEGGVYIETRSNFSLNEEVTMTYSFPGSKEYLKISGYIVRVEDTGIAVQFKPDTPVERISIRSQLEKL